MRQTEHTAFWFEALEKTKCHLGRIPAKTFNLNLIMKKHSDKPKFKEQSTK